MFCANIRALFHKKMQPAKNAASHTSLMKDKKASRTEMQDASFYISK